VTVTPRGGGGGLPGKTASQQTLLQLPEYFVLHFINPNASYFAVYFGRCTCATNTKEINVTNSVKYVRFSFQHVQYFQINYLKLLRACYKNKQLDSWCHFLVGVTNYKAALFNNLNSNCEKSGSLFKL
jgi:hypothetical protein